MNTFTYTFSTGVLSGGTLNGWSQTAPSLSAGDYLWAIQATAASSSSTDSIAANEFSSGSIVGIGGVNGTNGTDGNDGNDGTNTATVFLYRKNTSNTTAPALFTGTATYTFSTGAISGLTFNNWSQIPPSLSQGEYLWATLATASSTGSTDTIAIGEWATPFVNSSAITGQTGSSGYATGIVTLYRKNSNTTVPTLPTGTFTYTFATGALSGGTLNSWSQTAPTLSKGDYLFLIQATAYSNTSTASIAASSFSGANIVGIGGSDGSLGDDGLNSAPVFLYRKSTSSSTAPTLFSGTFTYTFSTKALSGGTLNNWTTTPPSLGENEYLWMSQATASSTTNTDTIPYTEFSTPAVISGNKTGATGATGGTGSRGAGWWRYVDSTNQSSYYQGLTQTTLNTRVDAAFSAGVGITAVEDDRFIISCTDDLAVSFIRNGSNWIAQAEFIDGNLLVSGTITSNALATNSVKAENIVAGEIDTDLLKTDAVTVDKMSIDGSLVLDGPSSAFIAGRTGVADFGNTGFYIGRTSSDGTTADGFQLSHTSVSNSSNFLGAGKVQAVIHDSDQGLRIYEPVFYKKGNGTSANDIIFRLDGTNTTEGTTIQKSTDGGSTYATGNTYTLLGGSVYTITLIGGGGGGSSGTGAEYSANPRGSYNPGSSGGTTTLSFSGPPGYTGVTSKSASGGTGGTGNTSINWTTGIPAGASGFAGAASSYGSGGSGGAGGYSGYWQDANGSPGSRPLLNAFGAGGGAGGGGIDARVNEIWYSDQPGYGGNAASPVTIVIDLTGLDNGTLTVSSIGQGGSGGSTVNVSGDGGAGGNGRGGAVIISSALEGYEPFTFDTFAHPSILKRERSSSSLITTITYPNSIEEHYIINSSTSSRTVEVTGSYQGPISWTNNSTSSWRLLFYGTAATAGWINVINAYGGAYNSNGAIFEFNEGTTYGLTTNMSTYGAYASNIGAALCNVAEYNGTRASVGFNFIGILPAGISLLHYGTWSTTSSRFPTGNNTTVKEWV